MDEEVVVDRGALATVLGAAGLGELSPALAPLATWTPPAERADELAAAWKELERVDLARHGGLDPQVADWLRLLASAAEERYAWAVGPGEDPHPVLAAAGCGQALLAEGDRDSVRLRRIRPGELEPQLVAALPEHRAGTFSLRVGTAELFDGGELDAQVRAFRQFAARPPVGLCELYAAHTPRLGTRRACQQPIWVRDTTQGRFVVAWDSSEVRVDPAGPEELVRRLREVRRGLGS